MDLTRVFNISFISHYTGISDWKLRSNFRARPERVTLTKEERDAILKAVQEGQNELKKLLG